jgi:hypothetical protein
MTRNVTTGYFEASLDFRDRAFVLAKDCIGSEVPFRYKSFALALCFPNFDMNDRDGFGHPKPTLKGTDIAMDWIKNRHNPLDGKSYGSETYRNDKEVYRFVCNQIIVRSKTEVTARHARGIKQALPEWQNMFIEWLEVLEYTDLEYGGVEVTQQTEIESFYVRKYKKARQIREKDPQYITFVGSYSEGMKAVQLQKALYRSEHGKRPPAYYTMLIDALKHLHQHRYRQSVLDTATALEMCFTELLEKELSSLEARQRELITSKHEGVVKLHEALKKLGVTLPSQNDMIQKVAKPRNDAVHRGIEISHSQAKDALEFVRSFIYTRLPL